MGGKRNKLKRRQSGSAKTVAPELDVTDHGEKDGELLHELMNELDARESTDSSSKVVTETDSNENAHLSEPKPKQNSKDRFHARQSRKAAVLVKKRPKDDPVADERKQREALQEDQTIKRICEELGVRVHEVNADGHCLYSAVADQLSLLSILPVEQATYMATRLAASDYIWTHPDDFLPFLPDDDPDSSETGYMSPQSFERYCVAIRDTGVWGGEPEILALSRAYGVPIHVVQSGSPPVVVHNPAGAPVENDATTTTGKVVRISYHRKMYGLGEHYNSLRPATPSKAVLKTLPH